MAKQASLKKVAVDSVAEAYWEDYYKDSGYGKLWVRKIPMQIKAALQHATKTAQLKRTASVDTMRIEPISTKMDSQGVFLEGLAISEGRKAIAFMANFSHEGELVDFDAVSTEK